MAVGDDPVEIYEINYEALMNETEGGVYDYHYLLTSGVHTTIEALRAFRHVMSFEDQEELKDSVLYKLGLIDQIANLYVCLETPEKPQSPLKRVK